MAAYTRHSRKKRDSQQYIVDDLTKCRGLTQEELDEDLKLLKLAEYTTPSTKYKISNPIISKSKRELITSIYDKKNISSDLAKTNNQLIFELNSLKKQMSFMQNEIIHNKTQIEISQFQKEIVSKQFEVIKDHKNKQIESLNDYNIQCKSSILKTENEIKKLITDTQEISTDEQALINALHTIKSLKNELKNKKEIITIIQKKELLKNTNDDILKLNEKFNSFSKKHQEQRRANNILRAENKQLSRELSESQTSYNDLFKVYNELNESLISLKYASNVELAKYNRQCMEYGHEIGLISSEITKYSHILSQYSLSKEENELLFANMSLDYYQKLQENDRLKKANLLLQNKYISLEAQNAGMDNKPIANKTYLSELEEERRTNNKLKEKYFSGIYRFKEDLDLLYLRTERTISNNNLMKQETLLSTLSLQKENDKLHSKLAQSHSNLGILQIRNTENDSLSAQKEVQHRETANKLKIIAGNKIDLEKRVSILKKAICDLNGALSDCHVQMLSFQKQVYDEMNCALPKDNNLILKKKAKKIAKKRKRSQVQSDDVHNQNQEINANAKRRKVMTPQTQRQTDRDIIDSSSSSEISHLSTEKGSDLYNFQGVVDTDTETPDEQKIFYSILSLSSGKDNNYILLNDYIKMTRRGHPDYTGRVESMFFDKQSKKKKVCVTIFQLASDIPHIKQCKIINENGVFNQGKREYVQLILANHANSNKKYKQFKNQKENTKIFHVGRIHTNKKVTLWFPKKNLKFKSIEKKTSGRDVYFCRYKYDKNNKTLIRIDGTDDKPISDYQ